jgi:hypothetical protein
MTVEEVWAKWSKSESGQACLDPDTLPAETLPPSHLHQSLTYRIRAAFVAGWIARDCADKPAQVTKEADNEGRRARFT